MKKFINIKNNYKSFFRHFWKINWWPKVAHSWLYSISLKYDWTQPHCWLGKIGLLRSIVYWYCWEMVTDSTVATLLKSESKNIDSGYASNTWFKYIMYSVCQFVRETIPQTQRPGPGNAWYLVPWDYIDPFLKPIFPIFSLLVIKMFPTFVRNDSSSCFFLLTYARVHNPLLFAHIIYTERRVFLLMYNFSVIVFWPLIV